MNRQEVFDKVATHLLTQKKKSLNERGCLYRGPNGMKCAIGVLIKDEFYYPEMERQGVYDKYVLKALEKSGIGNLTEEDINFLTNLQHIHDNLEPVKEWKEGLERFAERKGLDPKVLDGFKEA